MGVMLGRQCLARGVQCKELYSVDSTFNCAGVPILVAGCPSKSISPSAAGN